MAAALPPGIDLSKVPVGVNPNGSPPNFVDPPNLIGAVQGVGITLGITAFILLAVRLRVYVGLNRSLFIDDVFLIISFTLAVVYTALASTLGRMTKHTWDTPLSAIDEDYLKKLLVTSTIYGPMFFFAKAAILLLYYRAFKPKAWMRYSVYIIIFVMFFAYWMTVPMNFAWCMPHNGRPWTMEILQTCGKLEVPGLVHGAMNVLADVVITILPIPVIVKLRIPLRRKIAISLIFATGLLALICSVLAVLYRVRISNGNDAVWSNAQCWIVIEAEIFAAICVACMPSLAKFWKDTLEGTKLGSSIHSFLEWTSTRTRSIYSKSTKSEKTQSSRASTESESKLRTESSDFHSTEHPFPSVVVNNHGERSKMNQVYKKVTIDVSSKAASSEGDLPEVAHTVR